MCNARVGNHQGSTHRLCSSRAEESGGRPTVFSTSLPQNPLHTGTHKRTRRSVHASCQCSGRPQDPAAPILMTMQPHSCPWVVEIQGYRRLFRDSSQPPSHATLAMLKQAVAARPTHPRQVTHTLIAAMHLSRPPAMSHPERRHSRHSPAVLAHEVLAQPHGKRAGGTHS